MRSRIIEVTFIFLLACGIAASAHAQDDVRIVIYNPSISPNGDGVRDSSLVKVYVWVPCDTVAITLEDGAETIDTLLMLVDADLGSYNVYWTGEDSLGAPLPEGAYALRFYAVFLGMTEEHVYTVIVDLTPPIVRIDRIEPGIFTPGLAGSPEHVSIYFELSGYEEWALLTITVTDPEGTPEDIPPPDEITGDGLYVVEWSDGSAPIDGLHTVAFHIEDEAGNSSDDEGSFYVNAEGPIHGFVTPIPDVTREVPEILEGFCYDPNGVETPVLVWNDGDPAPPASTVMQNDTLIWRFNLRDSVTVGGEYIEGEYTLDVTCADLFGRETSNSLIFEIDRTPPPAPALTQPYSPVSDPDIVIDASYDSDEIDSFIVYRSHGGTTETTRMQDAIFINVTLEEGENRIWIAGIDEAGNVGPASNVVTVLYETTLGFFYPEAFRGPDLFRVLTGEEANKVHVDIYTVNGELVVTLKEFGPADSFDLEWDVTNGDGEEVQNGAYLVVISVFYADSKRVEKNFIAVAR